MQLRQETDRDLAGGHQRCQSQRAFRLCLVQRESHTGQHVLLQSPPAEKQAIEIREKQKPPSAAKQEVVKLDFAAAEQDVKVPDRTIDIVEASPANRTPAVKPEPVIRIRSGALTADIMSGADEWMIQSFVRALHQVC